MKKFFYHYNKPATQRSGVATISVHYDKKCHLVQGIEVSVPTVSKINKRSPRFVMTGYCNNIQIKKGIAVIS